ncbi:hypothetical protein M3Y97_00155300 [Aphelenchoides bicaudatus]|nr:hypothetical protein M3Y97_00155300 [Aphelenchoides bicaudatus]
MANIKDFVDQAVDLSTKFDKTDKSHGEVLQLIYENNSELVEKLKGQKIVDIEVVDIGKNKGYASYVYRVNLHFDSTGTYSFVLKVPTLDSWERISIDLTDEEREHNAIMIRQHHNTECASYDLLKDIANFPIPKVWYAKEVDETQVVDFQVYVECCLSEDKWFDKFKHNMHARSSVDHIWKKMIRPIEDYEQDKGLQAKIKHILNIDFFALGKYATETIAHEMGCETLVHGDVWTNNMLLKINPDGSLSDEILGIIDWQTVFVGSPLFDIARFLGNCASGELRREIEKDLVDFFYDQLTEKLGANGKKPKFTREQAHFLYKYAIVQETGLLCVMFAVIALPLKDSEKDQADVQKLAKRLNDLFDDAIQFMDEHGLHEKFKLQPDML